MKENNLNNLAEKAQGKSRVHNPIENSYDEATMREQNYETARRMKENRKQC